MRRALAGKTRATQAEQTPKRCATLVLAFLGISVPSYPLLGYARIGSGVLWPPRYQGAHRRLGVSLPFPRPRMMASVGFRSKPEAASEGARSRKERHVGLAFSYAALSYLRGGAFGPSSVRTRARVVPPERHESCRKRGNRQGLPLSVRVRLPLLASPLASVGLIPRWAILVWGRWSECHGSQADRGRLAASWGFPDLRVRASVRLRFGSCVSLSLLPGHRRGLPERPSFAWASLSASVLPVSPYPPAFLSLPCPGTPKERVPGGPLCRSLLGLLGGGSLLGFLWPLFRAFPPKEGCSTLPFWFPLRSVALPCPFSDVPVSPPVPGQKSAASVAGLAKEGAKERGRFALSFCVGGDGGQGHRGRDGHQGREAGRPRRAHRRGFREGPSFAFLLSFLFVGVPWAGESLPCFLCGFLACGPTQDGGTGGNMGGGVCQFGGPPEGGIPPEILYRQYSLNLEIWRYILRADHCY